MSSVSSWYVALFSKESGFSVIGVFLVRFTTTKRERERERERREGERSEGEREMREREER